MLLCVCVSLSLSLSPIYVYIYVTHTNYPTLYYYTAIVAAIRGHIESKSGEKFKAALEEWFTTDGCHDPDALNSGHAICDDTRYATSGYSLLHFAASCRAEFITVLLENPYYMDINIASTGGE
jgi:hypothetical protein